MYNNTVEHAKKESWRRYCDVVESAPEVPDSKGLYGKVLRDELLPSRDLMDPTLRPAKKHSSCYIYNGFRRTDCISSAL